MTRVSISAPGAGIYSNNKDGESLLRGGVFGDLFDFLNRPSSAVNTAIRYGTDDDPTTNALTGLKEGITGKTQTSFSDVLGDKGVTGWKKTLGGFAGDILLDPTTYVGVGAVKGLSKTEAAIQALKLGGNNVDNVAVELLAKNPSRIGLTVLGKPIHKGFKVPDTGIAEKILGPTTDRKTLVKAFSREAELPEGLNQMNRVIESAHNAKFNDFRQGVKNVFIKDLDLEQRKLISEALEKGTSLNSPVTRAGAKFQNLDDYVSLAKKINDDAFKIEADLGIHGLEAKQNPFGSQAFNPNYVYKFFNKPPGKFEKVNKAVMTLADAKAKNFDPVEDIAEILDLRIAKHHRMVQRNVFGRDAVEQFGIDPSAIKKLPTNSPIRKLNWVPSSVVDLPGIKYSGTQKLIPEFVASSLKEATKAFESGEVASGMLNGYTKALGQWKFWNTALPGTQVRNMFGDWINNLADGVNNPARYGQAAKVLKDVNAITANKLTGAVGNYSKIKIGNQMVDSEKIWDLFGESGAKSGMISTELMRSLNSTEKRLLTQQGSKLKAAWGEKLDLREDWMRMSHFIDSLDKKVSSKKFKTIEEAAQSAGEAVRKYNIDYGNLSSFEKKVMTKVIPFYSWMRRATPLNMELLFTKPGFMALYPKSQNALQELLGTDDGTGEQLIPEWIKETAPVRLALAKNNPLNGLLKMLGVTPNEPGFLSTTMGTTPFDTLDLPLEPLNLLRQGKFREAARSPVDDLVQQTTPLIKLPFEAATGRSTFTGQELDGNWMNWLASQSAPTRGISKGIKDTPASAITNSILGIPIQVATADRQEGEFNKRQDAKQQKTRDIKTNSLRERFGNYDDLPEARREALMKGMRNPRDPEAAQQRRYLTQILGQ